MDDGTWWAGQSQGLIDSVESCQEIVDGIMAEAEQLIGRLGALLGDVVAATH